MILRRRADPRVADLGGRPTRLKIRIRDIKADLAAKETYNPKGPKKKATRLRLRGLDRTEAEQELKELEEQLKLTLEAAKLNASKSGSIADRLAQYEQDQKAAEDAKRTADELIGYRDRMAADLGQAPALSMKSTQVQHTNAKGDIWYTEEKPTAASLAGQISKQAENAEVFAGKIDALRRAGAGQGLLEAVKQVAMQECLEADIAMADAFLLDKKAISTANSGYASLAQWSTAAADTMTCVAAPPVSAPSAPIAGLADLINGRLFASIPDDQIAKLAAAVVAASKNTVAASNGAVSGRLQYGLGVPGHQVGSSRLMGGRPPSALWRRSVL